MLIRNYLQLKHVLDWLNKQKVVSFDLETAPVDLSQPQQAVQPRKGQVIGIAVSNGTESFYVVHQHLNSTTGKFDQYLNKNMINLLLLELKKKQLETFNGSFDIRFCRHYFKHNMAPSLWCEVQLARHTYNENLDPWAGLKDIGMTVFGDSAGQEKRDLNEEIIANGGTEGQIWLGSLETVGKYARQDAILTHRLASYFIGLLAQKNLTDFFFKDEVMPLYREVTIDLEDYGVRLDIPVMLKAQQEITTDITNLDIAIRDKIKPYLQEFESWYLNKSITPKTSGLFAQTAAKFYGIDGVKTKTGSLSFSEKAMESMPDSVFKRFIEGRERLPSHDVLQIQRMMRNVDEAFMLTSKDHLKRIFFDHLKEKPLSFTKERKEPQVDDDFLESIKHKHDFVPLLLDYNKLNKLKSTYIDGYLEKSQGGRFYPAFHQHRTTSGRYSSNLQQLPRRKDEEESELSQMVLKYTNMIREFFIADEGKVLVGADYNSLEVVVFADDAGDEPLLDMIRNKRDFYSQVAIDALGLQGYSADKKAANFLKLHFPEKRQDAKVYGLGIRYGMGDYKLAKTLGIGQSEAKKIINTYFEKYPKLKTRMDELTTSAKTKGYVVSKAGRIRHLPKLKQLSETYGNIFDDSLKLWEKYHEIPEKYAEMKKLSKMYYGDINNCLNNPIQSMAASIVNRASVEIHREFRKQGLTATLNIQCHDELVASCDEKDAELVKSIMRDKMENTVKLSVPLVAEPHIAKRYSELK